jgi:6-phosphofructokinase 1
VLRQFITDRNVKILFVVGGDGTHRGALQLSMEVKAAGKALAIAGIPKTIDNDVAVIDHSFGFHSAVAEACRAVLAAKTEARSLPNGIGVVKLMGRYSGYIATHASVASGVVDLCLIPELPIHLEGPNSHLVHLRRVLKEHGHAVVVVAEGAGEEILGQQYVHV